MNRFYFLAALVCLAFGMVMLITVIAAMFGEPPSWNRADRLLQSFAWIYVAHLHWQLFLHLPVEEGHK